MFRILEIAWLIVGVIAICMTIYVLLTQGVNNEIILYLAIAFIAGLLYSIRRKQRIAFDRKKGSIKD